MTTNYAVKLVAKGECIEYKDPTNIYRFGVKLKKKRWKIYLPGSRGEEFKKYHLSEIERKTILPRIIKYLERKTWLGLFTIKYSVEIIDES